MANEYLHIKCPNCGSTTVRYSADKAGLHCEHCDWTKELPRERDKITERSLADGFDVSDMPTGLGVESTVFHCGSCGSEASISTEQVRVQCPFCGSENYNKTTQQARVIQPAGVLPFTVPKKRAQEIFRDWVQEGWFHPNALKKVQELDNIRGVYIPFWTFDAETTSTWWAEAGYYYYVTETYTDQNGNQQQRQVQHTRWEPASGYYENFFDDVLVIASHGVSQSMVQGVYPYSLEQVVNYDSQYVHGWETELYQKDVKEGFTVADGIMDNYIYNACAQQVPGDTHRNLQVSTQKRGLTFKHLLLPLWVAAYSFNGKPYQYIVNGQTGKAHGSKPLSPWKIALAVLIGAIVVGAVVYFSQQAQ